MNHNPNSFFQKYKCYFIVFFLVVIAAYVIIYLCFRGEGIIPAGNDLGKNDWLMFFGAYLAFAGAIFVGSVAALQSHYYVEQNEEKAKKERKKVIQPIFSVAIEEIDTSVSGASYPFSPYDLSTLPKHKNVTISIENVGTYPIRNVIIFQKYLYQLLKPNERKVIQIAYSDSPDMEKYRKYLIEIFEADVERSDEGLPEWFNINYDDVDGNEMYQTFGLKRFDGTAYYSLIDMQ